MMLHKTRRRLEEWRSALEIFITLQVATTQSLVRP